MLLVLTQQIFSRIPLLMNFRTLTTTLTFASPSDERGLSIISIGWLPRKLGALAVL